MNFPKLYECDPQKKYRVQQAELRKSVYAHYAKRVRSGAVRENEYRESI